MRKTGENSGFTYEQLKDLIKHDRSLLLFVNKIFDKYGDVVVYENNWKWDIECGQFAEQNEDFENDDCYDGDGWELSDLETSYKVRLHGCEEGDSFNWDKVKIDDNRVIAVVDEYDYVKIGILDFKHMNDGVIDFWGMKTHLV